MTSAAFQSRFPKLPREVKNLYQHIFLRAFILVMLLVTAGSLRGWRQLSPAASWAATAFKNYRVHPDITCLTANNREAEPDLYQPTSVAEPLPMGSEAKETLLVSENRLIDDH